VQPVIADFFGLCKVAEEYERVVSLPLLDQSTSMVVNKRVKIDKELCALRGLHVGKVLWISIHEKSPPLERLRAE
jgi:hypothetical protein